MTSPVPTIQVLLDDGTGTYPTDITSSVRMVEGLVSSRGRADEQSDNQPGSLTFTLDNTAGLLTPSGFGTGGFGGFGFGGGPSLDQGVRVKIAGLTRWTGRLQSIPVSWPTGGEEFAVVQATATDTLATLARRTLRSSSDEEILADIGVGAYYPMQEPSEAVQSSDLSGNNQAALVITGGTGAGSVAELGVDMLTPDGSTGVKLIAATGGTGGYTLQVTGGTWSASSVRFDLVLRQVSPDGTAGGLGVVTGTPQIISIGSANDVFVTYDTAAKQLSVGGAAIPPLIAVAADLSSTIVPHVMTVQCSAASLDLWLDGVKIGTRSSSATTFHNDRVVIGDATMTTLLSVADGFAFSRFNVGPRTTDARVVAHHAALLHDFAGETPTARVARVCGYAGVPTGSLDTTGSTTLGYVAQAGRNGLDVVLETAQADTGNVFADKNGAVTYISGLTTAGKGTPDASLDANWIGQDTAVNYDMTAVVNDVTGTTAVTDNSYRVTDAASITAHGVYPVTYTWSLNDDNQVQARTQWQLSNYSEPAARVGQLTVDLLTMDSTSRTAALALDLGAYLRATGMPLQSTGGTQLDVIVEGITETLQIGPGGNAWTLTLNVVQRSLVGAWVLGDTTWSVLGTTTKLAIG